MLSTHEYFDSFEATTRKAYQDAANPFAYESLLLHKPTRVTTMMTTKSSDQKGNNEPAQKSRLETLRAAVIKAVVPIRMRKAIFAASLVARLKDLTAPDKELAKRVGILMELTCDPSSLLYPMQINNWIWKDLSTDGIDLSGKSQLSSEQLHAFCTAVINSTPEALEYNTHRAMREDVYRLVMAFTPATASRMNMQTA